MSTAATVISNLGTFNWNAKVYDALALDSKLAVAVKNRGNVIRVAYHLRELNKSLEQLIGLVDSAMKEAEVKPVRNREQITLKCCAPMQTTLRTWPAFLNILLKARAGQG